MAIVESQRIFSKIPFLLIQSEIFLLIRLKRVDAYIKCYVPPFFGRKDKKRHNIVALGKRSTCIITEY